MAVETSLISIITAIENIKPSDCNSKIKIQPGKKLGEGGFGSVFVGTYTSTNKEQTQVAVKVMNLSKIPKKRRKIYLDAFKREVVLLEYLKGSDCRVVGFFDSFFCRDVKSQPYFIVLEKLDGIDLYDLIDNQFNNGSYYWATLPKPAPIPPLTLFTLCMFSVQICEAVECLHKNSVYHLDLKPENIMAVDDEGVKIIDFGLGCLDEKMIKHKSLLSLGKKLELDCIVTKARGSLGYMPPEEIDLSFKDAIGHIKTTNFYAKKDAYSLGCTLYVLWSGRNFMDIQKLETNSTDNLSREESAGTKHERTVFNMVELFVDDVYPPFIARTRLSHTPLARAMTIIEGLTNYNYTERLDIDLATRGFKSLLKIAEEKMK